MTTQKLTKKLIESDLIPDQVEQDRDTGYTVWDTFPGFGLVVYPLGPGNAIGEHATDGRKVFFVELRVNDTTREITIGNYGAITVEQAREMAQMIIAWAGLGEDLDILRKTAKRVINTLAVHPYRNKIRFREMVILALTKIKMGEGIEIE